VTRTAAAIRHVAFEDLGRWGPRLADRGFATSLMAVAVGGSARAPAAPRDRIRAGDTDAAHGSALEALGDVPVLYWHGDVISLPTELPALASTPLCENRAFARGTNLLGLQFHSRPAARPLSDG
jgi:GMP synthase-like glutamine amidotransferase